MEWVWLRTHRMCSSFLAYKNLPARRELSVPPDAEGLFVTLGRLLLVLVSSLLQGRVGYNSKLERERLGFCHEMLQIGSV